MTQRVLMLSALLFAVSAVRADVVNHWALDETEGLTAAGRDCAGNGELVGFDLNDDTQWVEGQFEGALQLGVDGIFDDRVVADLAAVSAAATGGFTVCMWINPGEAILNLGEYQLLATPGDAVGFTIMNEDLELRHDRVLLFWDGNLPDLHVGTTTLEPGTWYHVAITSGGADGDKLYYVNGEPEDQALLRPSQGGTQGFHPGTRDGWGAGQGAIGALVGGQRGHDTIIDDVRIYDEVLTADDLLDIMDTPPERAPEIRNVSPADGNAFHDAGDGLQFDVFAMADGATIAVEDIALILNGEDVSGDLTTGGTETEREVSYDSLEEGEAYVALIEVVDSNGSRVCVTLSFGTLTENVDGLVHHWAMDEESGLLARDTGMARTGDLIGFENNDDSQWVQGICDQALDLGADDTINNYVEVEISAVDTFVDGGFTIAMWLKPGEQILNTGEFQLLSTPGDTVGFTIMNNTFDGELIDRVLLFWDGSLPDLHVGTTTLEPGNWYHVAITSTGPGGEKLYFVNGELEEERLMWPSQGGTPGFHPGTSSGWGEGVGRIGAFGAGGRAHDSVVDDVRIYNRALDEGEIADVMEECDPLLCDPLVLEDLSPADGESFHDAAAGLELEVSTPNGAVGLAIDPDGIQMIVNGTDVSGDLEIGGTGAQRVVTYGGLEPDTAYDVEISITDGCASLERRITFGTFELCDDDDPSLRHRWKLDETSGSFALDCVGGALGTLVNFDDEDDSRWVDGIVDGALDFGADGSLNNAIDVDLPALAALDTGGFTVAMWIRPGEQILTAGEYQLLRAPGGGIGFTIMTRENEGFLHERVLLFWDSSLPNLYLGTTTLEPDQWYHVAITSTGAGGVKEYYVDGVLEEKAPFFPSQLGEDIATADGWPAGSARLGANIGLQGRNHDTVYDDVRIYEVALEEDEIAEIAGIDPPPEGVGPFVRGDCNGDGNVIGQVGDAVFVLNFNFTGGPRPVCMAACDSNADGNVIGQVGDAIYTLNFNFLGGPAIPEPFPNCARSNDPADVALGCETPLACP